MWTNAKLHTLHRADNNKGKYAMEGKHLEAMDEEKDLGVLMQSDLKWNRQCTKAGNCK